MTLASYADTDLVSTEDLEQTLDKIHHFEDEFQLNEYAYILLPNWILHRCDHYASEYTQLEENWYRLCARWNVTPREILIVQYIPDPSQFAQYQILVAICNQLTRYGYVVRNKSELFPCRACSKALLTEKVYDFLVTRNPQGVPKRWSVTCQACTTHDLNDEHAA
jgi:hypothetical protein